MYARIDRYASGERHRRLPVPGKPAVHPVQVALLESDRTEVDPGHPVPPPATDRVGDERPGQGPGEGDQQRRKEQEGAGGDQEPGKREDDLARERRDTKALDGHQQEQPSQADRRQNRDDETHQGPDERKGHARGLPSGARGRCLGNHRIVTEAERDREPGVGLGRNALKLERRGAATARHRRPQAPQRDRERDPDLDLGGL